MKEIMIKHYSELDAIKGVAMLSVIFGHCFCQFPLPLSHELPILSELIKGYQMPLFMLASGFLFNFTTPMGIFIQKKVKRLVIPYFFFAVISLMLRLLFSKYTNGEIELWEGLLKVLTGGYYWFLYSLMIIMFTSLIFNKIHCGLPILLVLSFLINYIYEDNLTSLFTLNRTLPLISFFVLGGWIRINYSKILMMSNRNLLLIALLSCSFYVIPVVMEPFHIDSPILKKFIWPLSGSIFIWTSLVVACRHASMKVISHFGKHSLQYYLNHLLIMLPIYYIAYYSQIKFSISHSLTLFLIFLFAVLFSFVILIIEQRIKMLHTCFGLC